ncbi:MAG: preprotein translocase subunit SecY [Candidatus Terrybacteria bacterium RIFCSPLOWO2_01_FULL_44_24]|uniref:Protein translocase subunit SecY n=1 Tax=Candidatus Terrybacteria bacterium RIFCSPHIGHO2_01_FULL_43_35 TaxID=1802361 RepID=A0A1G2PCZ7_9BACT|nr:MAG: preprotein translocase subunit SecY [Candidatus Terrybacteria bacterium RIFCSPHIGHO2_01_FULL_43_35]OHA49416.1 MAG: preprotein translocase subunit SecY [Candidatus Terrybacteria bacterium RIFCSPHIGHO2_02_FULL_43_14]OHA51643.1 MAG: preprotein translocase subunit SecY [Candidatus Terrybacteria bacterium RIFCSPLOWO2_01_FULL_44_24]
MIELISRIWKTPELRAKIFFVLAMMGFFRLAAAIPIPGIDATKVSNFVQSNQIFGLLNLFTGGSLEGFSVVMLGVGPYITATIIFQLLTMIFPKLKKLYYEEGERGRQRFNQYARILTVPLAMLQAFGFLRLLQAREVITFSDPLNIVTAIFVITASTIWLMWLGELISEKGIGNGVSLIIFAGIITTLPSAVFRTLIQSDQLSHLPEYILFAVVALIVIAGVVLINEGQRQIPVSYAKRIRGMRVYGGVSSHLPLRVNSAGVIPIIFALSILLFPGMMASVLSGVGFAPVARAAQAISYAVQNQTLYATFYFFFVVVFTYFYTSVVFDPKEVAQNLQKSGGFIPGIRPGQSTAAFISFIMNRITLAGAIFLGIIAVLPTVIQSVLPALFSGSGTASLTIGGTSVLIVVSVAIETFKQIGAQLSLHDYENF